MRIRVSILHDLCEDDSYVCEYAVAFIYIPEGGLNEGGGVKCRNKLLKHITRVSNIPERSGKLVGVDAYVWLISCSTNPP